MEQHLDEMEGPTPTSRDLSKSSFEDISRIDDIHRYIFKENEKRIFQDWNSLVNVVCTLYSVHCILLKIYYNSIL